MNVLLNKILNTSIKKSYLIISGIGIVIGLSLTTICIDTYHKILSTVMGRSGDESYMIVNKKVSFLNTLMLSDNTFDEQQITDIKSQPFIEDVGTITASSCRIWAFRDKAPLKFKTDIFFESLEDKFLDKIPREWNWDKGQGFVPVMVNTDFLNLYNFAFAKAKNLPQFTKSTIGQFVVFLEVRGRGKKRLFKARIVDVSDRIPSIIAPQSFLDHINNTYGKKPDGKYSRIILKVNNPSEPALKDYLDKNGIVANQDLLSSGKSKAILSAGLGSYTLLAGIILILAIIIVILTFELVVSSSMKEIKLLQHLGTHSRVLASFFRKKLFILLGGQVLASLILILIVAYFSSQYLEENGYSNVPFFSIYALLSFILCTVIYYLFFHFRITKALEKH